MQFMQIIGDSVSRHLSAKASNWIEIYVPRFVFALIIIIAGQWIIKVVSRGTGRLLTSKRVNATLRPFLQNLVNICLQLVLILAVMQVMGIKMALFAALLGAFGVAAGLALSGTMQNFAGGVLIIIMQPFRVGENIQAQGEKGTVTAIRLFYTVIRTFNNTTLIIPNGKLSNEIIFNLTREAKSRLDITLKFTHKINYKDVQQKISDALISNKEILDKPHFRIGIDKIEQDGYIVIVNVWVRSHGFEDVKLAINEKLVEVLKPIMQT